MDHAHASANVKNSRVRQCSDSKQQLYMQRQKGRASLQQMRNLMSECSADMLQTDAHAVPNTSSTFPLHGTHLFLLQVFPDKGRAGRRISATQGGHIVCAAALPLQQRCCKSACYIVANVASVTWAWHSAGSHCDSGHTWDFVAICNPWDCHWHRIR